MTAPPDNPDTLLAAVRAHLAAAEEALALDNSPGALTARAEIAAALAAHEQHARRLSHDLRNALTAISGQAQMLARYLKRTEGEEIDPARVRRTLSHVSDATANATEVSRQIAGN